MDAAATTRDSSQFVLSLTQLDPDFISVRSAPKSITLPMGTAKQGARLRTGIQFRIRVVASDNRERTLKRRMPESGLGSIPR